MSAKIGNRSGGWWVERKLTALEIRCGGWYVLTICSDGEAYTVRSISAQEQDIQKRDPRDGGRARVVSAGKRALGIKPFYPYAEVKERWE